MALYRSDAFVLRTYKLGESDQIIVFFTEDYGKVRAVARRSRSARRQTASYYQPLMLIHAILFGRPSQALHRINSVDIVEPFRSLRDDFDTMQCGLYMTELIDLTTRDREPAPELFGLLRLGLEALTQTPSTEALLRLFELKLLMLIGYTPQVFDCARCAQALGTDDTTFSLSLGGLLCQNCQGEQRQTLALRVETVAYLRQVIMTESETMPQLPEAPEIRQEIGHALHQHLTARLGREIKSYAFLHL